MWNQVENLRGPEGPAPSWIDVPFLASNYSGSGSMIWTVEAGDVIQHTYALSGKVLLLLLTLLGTTISGTISSFLNIKLPPGMVVDKYCCNGFLVVESGTILPAYCSTTTGYDHVEIRKVNGANFGRRTNALDLTGQIILRLN